MTFSNKLPPRTYFSENKMMTSLFKSTPSNLSLSMPKTLSPTLSVPGPTNKSTINPSSIMNSQKPIFHNPAQLHPHPNKTCPWANIIKFHTQNNPAIISIWYKIETVNMKAYKPNKKLHDAPQNLTETADSVQTLKSLTNKKLPESVQVIISMPKHKILWTKKFKSSWNKIKPLWSAWTKSKWISSKNPKMNTIIQNFTKILTIDQPIFPTSLQLRTSGPKRNFKIHQKALIEPIIRQVIWEHTAQVLSEQSFKKIESN